MEFPVNLEENQNRDINYILEHIHYDEEEAENNVQLDLNRSLNLSNLLLANNPDEEIENSQEGIFEHLNNGESASFYFQGYTSEDLSLDQQEDIYYPYFKMFPNCNNQVVYPWKSGHITYSMFDVSKALFNIAASHDIFKTNYGKSFNNCQNEVIRFYELFKQRNIGSINLTGYSLGTQFIYYFLQLLVQSPKRSQYTDKVDNVVLLAGVLSAKLLTRNLRAFMGKDGPIKGNIVIVSSKSDYVLQCFVHYLQANSEIGGESLNDPVGRANFDKEFARESLKNQYEDENDPEIEQILSRIKSVKIEEKIKGPTIGHLGYMFPVNANRFSGFVKEELD